MSTSKIAILGAGNMGGATALGLYQHASVTVTAARDADVVILGVKPWLVQKVLEQILPVLDGKVLLSMAAGIPASRMAEWLQGSGVRAAYTVIPNLAMEQAGFTSAVIAGLLV